MPLRFFIIAASCSLLFGCSSVSDYLKSPFAKEEPSQWSEGRFERLSIAVEGITDGELSYVRAGKSGGQRVIFIHGSPGYAADWIVQLEDVPEDREYIAVDRLGNGWSKPLKAFPELKLQARALAPLFETEDDRPVILVGFSLGGPVAVRAAIDYPDKVGGLILASSNLDPELEPYAWYNEVASWLIVKPFIKNYWWISNQEILPHKKELEKMLPHLEGVSVPIAILHSENDGLVPVANTEFMRKQMHESQFVSVRIVEGDNHMLPIDQPVLTAPAINEVILALESERAGLAGQVLKKSTP